MDSSFIVYEASAGSGKTFTLAVRYIKLLISGNPQEYRHTLAVTFTNKATAEMKERIMEQLYGISRGLKSSEPYVEALLLTYKEEERPSTEEIRRACGVALHEILHDYSRFRIETIDSFFQSVLRNLAHELGLSANIQVDLNDKEILSQAVDDMIDDLGKKDTETLKWINNYIKERIEQGNKWDVREELKDFARCIFSESFMSYDENLRQRITSSENLKPFRQEMNRLEKEIKQRMTDTVKLTEECLQSCGLDLEIHVAYGSTVKTFLEKCRNISLTTLSPLPQSGDFYWNKTLEKITMDGNSLLKKEYKDQFDALAAAESLKALRKVADLCTCELLTIRLAYKNINPMRLLNHIDRKVSEISTETNSFILAKTPILLSRLVQGSDAPFVFEKMGTLFHNVMIDEFQDTSRLQWRNFKVLMLENQSQGGHDLLVGDIKQSIYRWRNGDWKILGGIQKEMASHHPFINPLKTNFRSEYYIIQFNNGFFTEAARLLNQASSKPDEITHIYSDVAQHCNKKEKKGYVRVAVYGATAKEYEEEMLNDLCHQVKTLHEEGIPYDEMCILQRTHAKIDRLIEHFKTALPEVPLISDEAFRLESSRSLSLIIYALTYLCNGDKDPVALHLLMQRYITDILKKKPQAEEFALSTPEEILPEPFINAKDKLSTHPLIELCEELYSLLNLNLIEGEDSYLLSFYDELSAYQRNAPGDIASFLDYWEKDMKKKSIPACKVNGISVVTIHKSKGLQYHTVLMPYCDFDLNRFKGDLLWCRPQTKPFNQLELLPIHADKRMKLSHFASDMAEEDQQKKIEELNALYVAFTRAERNLLVWCQDRQPKEGDSTLNAGHLINQAIRSVEDIQCKDEAVALVYTLGEPVLEVKPKDKEETNRLHPVAQKQTIRMCSFHRKHDFKQSTEGMLYIEELDENVDPDTLRTTDGLTFAQQGSLLHEMFSRIERTEQTEGVVQEYVNNGVLAPGPQVERITKLIRRALGLQQARHWFDGTYTIHNECEITFYNKEEGKGEVLRPDRVMMNDNEIIVVDFKFGKPHPEEYALQVKSYMDLLQEMYPDHTLSGYIWYVYRNQIVPVEA